jgi:hypothetical protein
MQHFRQLSLNKSPSIGGFIAAEQSHGLSQDDIDPLPFGWDGRPVAPNPVSRLYKSIPYSGHSTMRPKARKQGETTRMLGLAKQG